MSPTGQARVHIESARERPVSRIIRCSPTESEARVIHGELQVFRLVAAVEIFNADVAEVEECRAQTLNVRVVGNEAARQHGLGADQPGVPNRVRLGQIASATVERGQQIVRR